MSDCGVCIYGDDSGYTEFCDSRIQKARRAAFCCECEKPIDVGQKYEYAYGKTEGHFWTVKTCLMCAEIADTFYCEGRMYGGSLWDSMKCVFPDMTTGCLAKLETAAAKAFLLAQWNEWKFGRTPPSGEGG